MAEKITYDEQTLKTLHEVELSILDTIAEICTKHNINWFLEGGTALGAIRHKGFIPWDDDVDVSMMRQDYDRFTEIIRGELPDNMRFDSPENNLLLPTPFAKIIRTDTVFTTPETIGTGYKMGVFVDIFCYDKLSSNETIKQKQLSTATYAVRKKYLYASGNVVVPGSGLIGKLQKLACLIAHPLIRLFSNMETINAQLQEAITIGNPSNDPINEEDAVFLPGWPYIEYDASDFIPTRLEPFEGRMFPVPGKVEHYLSLLYENWEELPPIEKRKSHRPIELTLPQD